ncbi:unnamed protein product [Thelazia callipaeda]|uniref:B-cell receptor CD22 n=1 Tax=Thelazia callipaeda TaxID=103827 RepID=A0A0N5CP59_THECL|nr:unnamed protein product [Thelazia callipaeda]
MIIYVFLLLVEPQKPVITRQPSSPVHEGELITIECQTTGGNPSPSFTWVFNNRTVVPEDWYQIRSSVSPGRPSVSILQWRVDAEDNEAYLNCQIWNEAMPKNEHKDASTTRLNVLYGPRVHVGPLQEYHVEEGERVELSCTADGNPTPSLFEWYHIATGQRFAGTKWQFLADRRHTGDFRCTATNSIESNANMLTLDVQYGPIVKVEELLNPAEGDTVTLECAVDANPPPNSIVWTAPNDVTWKGPIFKIESVQRMHSGNYTCTATNTLTVPKTNSESMTRMGQAFTIIDVLRRPGKAVISASSSVIAVGDKTTLTCTALDPGSPLAEYRWSLFSGSSSEWKNPSYTIERATLADNGEYQCTPFNKIGDGVEDIFTLQVIEPSKITRPLPDSRVFNSGEKLVTLSCEAQGYPAPEFEWVKDGQVITSIDGSASHWLITSERLANNCPKDDYCSITRVSFLNFMQPLTWTDKGNYSCVSRNGLQKFATSSIALSVIHAPVILNERYSKDALAAADIGSVARIVCRVSARPEPRFVWFRNGSEIIHDSHSRYFIRNSAVSGKIDEFRSVLEIADSVIYDHGPYICRSSNDNGQKAELVIKLQAKSKPHPPSNLHVVSSLPTSLLVGWHPSFDGGEEQSFQFEYRKVNPLKGIPDSTEPITIYIDNRNASYLTLYEEDDTGLRSKRAFASVSFMIYNITHLNPLSTYWFRVRAKNLRGNSDWTPVSTATTADIQENAAVPRPLTLYYNDAKKTIDFETKQLNNDLCVLLLIMVSKSKRSAGSLKGTAEQIGNWRVLDCFDQTPVYDVPSVDYLKARLCHKQNLANCSAASEVIMSSTLLPFGWKYGLPFVAVIVFLLLILCFVAICWQIQRTFDPKNKKGQSFASIEKKNDVNMPLSQSDTKNTFIHGSQADSGVFTLGSTPNTNQASGQLIQNAHAFSTITDAVTDHWNPNTESFAYSNDPYIHELGAQYQISPSSHENRYDGFINRYASSNQQLHENRTDMDNPSAVIHDDHDSDETSYTMNGTRRIMREIIV